MRKTLISLLAGLQILAGTVPAISKAQVIDSLNSQTVAMETSFGQKRAQVQTEKNSFFPKDYNATYNLIFQDNDVGQESWLSLKRIPDNPQTKNIEAYRTHGRMHFDAKVLFVKPVHVDLEYITDLNKNQQPIRSILILKDNKEYNPVLFEGKTLEQIAHNYLGNPIKDGKSIRKITISDFEKGLSSSFQVKDGYSTHQIPSGTGDLASCLLYVFNEGLKEKKEMEFAVDIAYDGKQYKIPIGIRPINNSLYEIKIDMNSPLIEFLDNATVQVSKEGVPYNTRIRVRNSPSSKLGFLTKAIIRNNLYLESRIDSIAHPKNE